MKYQILARDQKLEKWKERQLLTPSGSHYLKLARFQASEVKLNDVKKLLSDENCTVTRLQLERVKFNNRKSRYLAEGINNNGSIQEIYFKNCKFRIEHFQMIADALTICESVHIIKMFDVNILVKQASLLGQILQQNQNIVAIDLRSCGIGDAALIELVKGIRENKNLTYIDLRHNSFEKEGLNVLIQALSEMMSCKVLKFEGLNIDEEDAILLANFFKKTQNVLEEIDLHDGELTKEIFHILNSALSSSRVLKSVSYSKNHLAKRRVMITEDLEETLQSFERDQMVDSEDSENEHAGDFDDSFMRCFFTKIMQPLINTLERICLSHCYIGDEGLMIICENYASEKLAYCNFSWNHFSEKSVKNLAKFIENNQKLEKLLLQHNRYGSQASIEILTEALKDHKSLRYLDLSANGIDDQSFAPFFRELCFGSIQLHTLHCRKNRLTLEDPSYKQLFQCLHKQHTLKVINFNDNKLVDSAGEQLQLLCEQNIFIESVSILRNKLVNHSRQDTIDEHCRMNLSILKFILSKNFPEIKYDSFDYNIAEIGEIDSLYIQDEEFFLIDFIFKLCKLNINVMTKLVFEHVFTEQEFITLPIFLEREAAELKLQELRLISCNISDLHLQQTLFALRKIKSLKKLEISEIPKVMDNQNLLLLTKCLAKNATLEELCLKQNQITDFNFLQKFLLINKNTRLIDVGGNYMTEEIIENIASLLEQNISLTQFDYFPVTGIVFSKQVIFKIKQELGKNQFIQDYIVPQVRERRESNNTSASSIDLSGKQIKYEKPDVLLKFLKYKKSKVKHLNLSDSQMSAEILKEINDLIKTGVLHLEILDISRNVFVNDAVCEMLAEVLQTHTTLQKIILDETQITLRGFCQLMEATIKNTVIESISISNCSQINIIDNQNSLENSRILTAITKNCSLTSVPHEGIQISQEFEDILMTQLEQNKLIVKHIFPIIRQQELAMLVKMKNQQREEQRKERQHQKLLVQHGKDRGQNLQRAVMGTIVEEHKRIGTFRRGQDLLTDRQQLKNPDNQYLHVPQNLKKGGSVNVKLSKQRKRQLFKGIYQDDYKDSQASYNTKNNVQDKSSIKLTHPSFSEDNSSSFESQFIQPESVSNRTFDQQTRLKLNLGGIGLQKLDFLEKFIRVFPEIHHIDLAQNKLNDKEMKKLTKVISSNRYIQQVDVRGNDYKGKTIRVLNRELEKNKLIMDIMDQPKQSPFLGHQNIKPTGTIFNLPSGGMTLNIANQPSLYKDISFLNKMLTFEDLPFLEELNVADNNIGIEGVTNLCQILKDNITIKRINVSGNNIGHEGLQILCAALCENSIVKSLDISNNNIPDRNLKVLLALLNMNQSIKSIKYSLTDPENLKKWETFKRLNNAPGASYRSMLQQNHHEIPLWQKIVFPIWIWKTFIHAKHEAFRFKYHAKKLNQIENKLMFQVGVVLYFTTIIYFGIMFGFPFLDIHEECGFGFDYFIWYTYGLYAFLTGVYEVYAVIKIEKEIKDSEILSFNRWHVVELLMGQIARFDTFLDCCFLVMLIQCGLWNYAIPVAIFISSMLSYPVFQLFNLCKVNNDLAHTQKYLERNCQLAFIRENMLLATVMDSFALNNSVKIFGYQVCFGKLMGAYTFIFQDFPQMFIHLYFMFFDHSESAMKLHESPIVTVAVITGIFAMLISVFNMVMFQQNEFDPILIEKELIYRQTDPSTSYTDTKLMASHRMRQEGSSKDKTDFFVQGDNFATFQPTKRRIVGDFDNLLLPQIQEEKDEQLLLQQPQRKISTMVKKTNQQEASPTSRAIFMFGLDNLDETENEERSVSDAVDLDNRGISNRVPVIEVHKQSDYLAKQGPESKPTDLHVIKLDTNHDNQDLYTQRSYASVDMREDSVLIVDKAQTPKEIQLCHMLQTKTQCSIKPDKNM